MTASTVTPAAPTRGLTTGTLPGPYGTAPRGCRFTSLHAALLVSVLLHTALLLVRFAAPEQFNRIFRDTPLEVILVNAHTGDTAPEKVQALAQVSMAGGGDATQGRATSPLPYSALTIEGDDIQEQMREIEHLMQQQATLLTQLRQRLGDVPEFSPQQPTPEGSGQDSQRESRLNQQRLLAEIERRINEQNARPIKRFVGPSTRQAVYALYYDSVRRKVEDKGTTNFPQHGGRKLYGQLVMSVTIAADGSVVQTQVLSSSGNPVLDRLAEAITTATGPFEPFPPQMRAQFDQMAPVFTFSFTHEQKLGISMQSSEHDSVQ